MLKASDIHFEPRRDSLVVRLRVDGILTKHAVIEKALHPSVISRIKIMCDMDIGEQRVPLEGRAFAEAGGKKMDLRTSTIPTVNGEKAVIRLLDRGMSALRLEDLGMSEHDLAAYRHLITTRSGMVIVTGPTGSGKTTTLYATLCGMASDGTNIVTIEDPVEYELDGISQMNVNTKAGLTFAKGLRSVLRQDPNVIMVGEIRDGETASIAVSAAMTGHLVLTTMHTADSVSAIARLVDLGVPPFMVSSAISGVVAQRLVRTFCDRCKGSGCVECKDSGYKGRTGLFEVLSVNDQVREMINDGRSRTSIRERTVLKGMRTMDLDGKEKVWLGITSKQEVSRVIRTD